MRSFSCLNPFPRKKINDYENRNNNGLRQIAGCSTGFIRNAINRAVLSSRYCVRLSECGRKVNKIGPRMAKKFQRRVFRHFLPFYAFYGNSSTMRRAAILNLNQQRVGCEGASRIEQALFFPKIPGLLSAQGRHASQKPLRATTHGSPRISRLQRHESGSNRRIAGTSDLRTTR